MTLQNKIEELSLKAQDSLKECPEISNVSFRFNWPDLEDMEAVAMKMGVRIDVLRSSRRKILILNWEDRGVTITITHEPEQAMERINQLNNQK